MTSSPISGVEDVIVIVGLIVSEAKNNSKNEGRKEIFYLTTHSTHFIYGYICVRHMNLENKDKKKQEGRKVLFNNTLNTFYLRLYG